MTRRAQPRTVAVADLSMLVRDGTSRRPALLLLHPANLRADCWRRVVAALPRDQRCVVPDLAGHGCSARTGAYGVASWAEDCERVLDALGLDRCHVVGASAGAAIAVALAVRRPDTVASVGTVGGAFLPAPAADDPLLAAFAAGGDVDDLRREMARASVAPDADEELIDVVAADISANSREAAEALWRAALATDVRPDLAGLVAPCWSVVGAADSTCPPSESQWFADLVNGTLVVLPGVGHLPMYEAPDALAALINQFIAPTTRSH